MDKHTFDLVVVGGGPGGYVAAIRAAQLGMNTALVEKAELGGVCLNWGCIPTKALLRSADVLRLVGQAHQYGVQVGTPTPDLSAMVSRSRSVAAQLNRGVKHLLKKHAVAVYAGHAQLTGPGRIEVSMEGAAPQQLRAAHVVLATGARPRLLPELPPDGQTVWTYRDALVPAAAPARMLILGAGAIGVEFASFYRAIGVDVTLAEMQDRVLPVEDEEVSARVAAALARDGIHILTRSKLERADRHSGGWQVQLTGRVPTQLQVDVVLVAAGIVGNVENLGLEKTAVRVERSHIVTDERCRTHEPGIYAIGDVAGPPWLAHKASHEGVLCVESIAGLQPHPLAPLRIPACTYSHPQVASVGLTEAQARADGRAVRVGKFPFNANGKALAMGATEGFAKVIFDDTTGELLGAHLVGDEVTELIHGFVMAQELETTDSELAAAVLPHPTLSEALHEAVLAAQGRALHL